MMRRTRHDNIRDLVIRDLQPSFSFPIFNRITIVADVEHYSKEDPWVVDQHRGNKPDYYEIYWDTTWICDFTTAQNPRIVYINFWHGMLNAYSSGQIELNEWQPGFDDIGAKVDDSLIKDGLMAKNSKGILEKTVKLKDIEIAQKQHEVAVKEARDNKIKKVITKLKTSGSEIERTAGEVIETVESDRQTKKSLKKGTSVVH